MARPGRHQRYGAKRPGGDQTEEDPERVVHLRGSAPEHHVRRLTLIPLRDRWRRRSVEHRDPAGRSVDADGTAAGNDQLRVRVPDVWSNTTMASGWYAETARS